jgi:spore maturation protein SpmB
MRILFPDVPPEHPAMGAMVLNMAANMLGLGNAATPLGLRAMAHLEKLNPRPGVATNAMCTFLAINTASIQLVPTTAIGILAVAGSKNPAAIWPTAFFSTLCAACCGVVSAKLLEKLPMFRLPPAAPPERGAEVANSDAAVGAPVAAETIKVGPLGKGRGAVLVLFLLAFVAMFTLLAFPDSWRSLLAPLSITPPAPPADLVGKPVWIRLPLSLAILAIPFMLSFFPLYAALRGVRVYEQFVEGAREAFETAKRVIPFLVAMLVSISLLRNAGVIDQITNMLRPLFEGIGFPPDLLPMVLIRPLSGSATQGIFVELVQRFGPDNIVSRIAATIYGSTETTFYVLAVYFGSVAIRQTRHAIAAGLIADTVAVIASVALCRIMFGA